MTPEQQEFYEKLGDALALTIHDFFEKYGQTPCKIRVDAMQKLHDLWPTLCEPEWQPIRTLDFENLDEVFILVTGLCTDGENQHVSEVWVNDGVLYDFNMQEIKISELTHWMRKPTPPTISKAVGGGE